MNIPIYEVRVGGRGTGIVMADTADDAGCKMVSVMGFEPDEYKQSMPGFTSRPTHVYFLQTDEILRMRLVLAPVFWTWPYLLYAILLENASEVLDNADSIFKRKSFMCTSPTIEELKEKGFLEYRRIPNDDILFWMCLDWKG